LALGALELFNKHAGMKLDAKLASLDALDAVMGKQARICPLICEHGFRANGERCEKIVCRAGHAVGDDNTCEKIEPKKPVAKLDAPAGEPKRSSNPRRPRREDSRLFAHCLSRAGRLPRVVGLLAREILVCLPVPIEKSAIDANTTPSGGRQRPVARRLPLKAVEFSRTHKVEMPKTVCTVS
jgi:hypothetical protein